MSEIEPVIGWPAHDRQIMSLLSDRELEVSNLRAEVATLREAMEGIVHFSDALNHQNDPLSRALAQWIEAGRAALEAKP